jgi:hypothetical protein
LVSWGPRGLQLGHLKRLSIPEFKLLHIYLCILRFTCIYPVTAAVVQK